MHDAQIARMTHVAAAQNFRRLFGQQDGGARAARRQGGA